MLAVQSNQVFNIPVIRVVNPFDPRDFVRETFVWERSKSLAEYFPLGMVEHVVSINGQPVDADKMAVTYLDKTDNLVICPIPLGGGDDDGGKSILRVVAMIAIAVFAPYLAGAMGATAGTMGAAMLTAGISMVGGLLVNALLPPPKPKQATNGIGTTSDVASSPTYGVDGAKNSSAEGLAVPVCYGGFRMAGNILDMFVENIGNTQYLYMLLNAGEGPIISITDVEINDQPASNFKNVEIITRTGAADQAMIPWFADTVTPHSVSKKLVTGEYIQYETEGVVDRLRFDIVFPQGLGQIDATTGVRGAFSVDLVIQVAKKNTGNWITLGDGFISHYNAFYHYPGGSGYSLPAPYYTLPPGTLIAGVFGSSYSTTGDKVYEKVLQSSSWEGESGTVTNYVWTDTEVGYVGQVPVYASGIRVTENTSSPVRRSYYSPVLDQGIYQARLLRTNADSTSQYIADDVAVTDINEIILDDVAYVNTALLGLKIQLDEQLNGVPNVTFYNGGRVLREYHSKHGWQQYRAPKNPAWIVLDALTHPRYGGGMSDSRFDMEMFKEWANYCDANNLTFEAVIDTSMNAWDAIQPVFRCGHAQIVNVGTRYTVVIERAAGATMMFGVGNIIDGSFKQSWLPVTGRANEIEVTYFDRADSFKQRSIRVVDQVAAARGDPQRPSAITLVGIVDKDKAYKEGFFQLNLNRYILQTIEFSAPIEAIACTIGDLIYVQHDMPQWGFAGRTEKTSTASVIALDREVTIESGKQYKLLLKLDAVKRAQGSIVNAIGDSLILSGWNGTGRVRRFQAAGLDRAVLSTFDAGGGLFGVVVEGGAFLTGATYELWDTDVIEERDVVATPGVTTAVTAMSPFSQTPGEFVNWMFGEVTKVKKPFRVRMIKGTHEYTRDLSCIEYNASCYDFSGMALPTPNYSSLAAAATHAIIGGVTETVLAIGADFVVRASVGFHSPHSSYADSTVKVSINGAAFQTIATKAKDSASVDCRSGDVLQFKVIAYDVLGSSLPESSAPTITHAVVGTKRPPITVVNFFVEERATDLLATWKPNPELYITGYEIRLGQSWDSAAVVTTNFSGTMLQLDQDFAGTYRYFIRAIGVGGLYSEGVAAFEVTLKAPGPVAQFDCVQASNRLEFRWLANSEQNIVNYEIREGSSWSASNLISEPKSTSLSIPSGSAGSRLFWIKAVASPGVYGDIATFVRTDIAQASNTNLIFSDDQKISSFAKVKHNVVVTDGNLVMSPGAIRSEYIFKVDLAAKYRGRNSMFTNLDSLVQDVTAWSAAGFSWSSTDASRRWIQTGATSSTSARYQIAVYRGLGLGEIDGWALDGSTTSVNAVAPTQATGVTYGQGRYGQGVLVKDTTLVSWPVSVPSVFTQHFWIRPEQVTNAIFWTVLGAAGIKLSVRYSVADSCFYLEDHLTNKVKIPYSLGVGHKLLMAVSQSLTARRLFLGNLDGSIVLWKEEPLTPAGAFTSMRLY